MRVVGEIVCLCRARNFDQNNCPGNSHFQHELFSSNQEGVQEFDIQYGKILVE